MFTGIIEELGRVNSMRKGANPGLRILADKILSDLKVGDSVSVNGVCITATKVDEKGFEADVMPETLKKTGLGGLRTGDRVNLERALRVGDRIGGHMVSGHVDGVGKIRRVVVNANARLVSIEAPKEIAEFLVSKGSVALDGVSLTVVDVTKTAFTVSLIPQTLNTTDLGKKKAGSVVNIEVDMIAKMARK